MTSPPAPNRFISRAAGARNAVERAELLQMVPTCRTVYQVAHMYSNGVALQKSAHFWLPMLLCADFPAAYSPALTSFAELTEAGQQSPGHPWRRVPQILPSSLTSASSLGQKVSRMSDWKKSLHDPRLRARPSLEHCERAFDSIFLVRKSKSRESESTMTKLISFGFGGGEAPPC